MDHNHTDKYQISLRLYFETKITLICALYHFENAPNKARKHFAKTNSHIPLPIKQRHDCGGCTPAFFPHDLSMHVNFVQRVCSRNADCCCWLVDTNIDFVEPLNLIKHLNRHAYCYLYKLQVMCKSHMKASAISDSCQGQSIFFFSPTDDGKFVNRLGM